MDPGPRKIARNPVSSSSDSQPNEYQICPTLTIDRYSSHNTSQSTIHAHSGARSTTSASKLPITPAQETPAKNRSE